MEETVVPKKLGRPPKAKPVLQSASSPAPPEPLLVAYSLKGEPEQKSFRCSTRSQEGPFLVFTSREGWQEKRFHIAISEIATLEITGSRELIGNPAGAFPPPAGLAPAIPPSAAQLAPVVEMPPQGSYSAATTFKEMQARSAMLRSDQHSLQSTVIGANGGLEVIGAAFMDNAPD